MRHERLTAVPGGLGAACIGKIGFLLHRQRIELGAHHDGRAVAVIIDRDEAGPADFFGHLESECMHLGGEFCGGLHLLEREFGIGVQILVERVEFWIVGLERGLDCSLQARNIHLGIGWQNRSQTQRGGHKQGSCRAVHDVDPLWRPMRT